MLDVSLPPETRHELESLLEALRAEVFVADDSLGWVYQFWQADAKEAVNTSEVKIGADELPAVTQLFTEDYMVLFLLHNTLGAWWAGKVLAAQPELAQDASSEDELRRGVRPPGRRVDVPALRPGGRCLAPRRGDVPGLAGGSEGPHRPRSLHGQRSLPRLRAADPGRAADARRSRSRCPPRSMPCCATTCSASRLDPRCTQLAAFNLALCAWRLGGYRTLPRLNLACSGLAISAREEDWAALAGADRHARGTMEKLHALFRQAPILGSLIDPLRVTGPLFATEIASIRPLLDRALKGETGDDAGVELAVAAQGVAAAADLLGRQYHLVITNVPYLKRDKQCAALRDFCERHYPDAKNDLANVFLERCLDLARSGHAGVVQLVMPQNWLFLTSYRKQRERLLTTRTWNLLARLGPGAFETISGEVVNVVLLTQTHGQPPPDQVLRGLDASAPRTAEKKAALLVSADLRSLGQAAQLGNPDTRVVFHRERFRRQPARRIRLAVMKD